MLPVPIRGVAMLDPLLVGPPLIVGSPREDHCPVGVFVLRRRRLRGESVRGAVDAGPNLRFFHVVMFSLGPLPVDAFVPAPIFGTGLKSGALVLPALDRSLSLARSFTPLS